MKKGIEELLKLEKNSKKKKARPRSFREEKTSKNVLHPHLNQTTLNTKST